MVAIKVVMNPRRYQGIRELEFDNSRGEGAVGTLESHITSEAAPRRVGFSGREKTLTHSARPMVLAARPMTPQPDRLFACPHVLAPAGTTGVASTLSLPENARGNAEDEDDEMFGCRGRPRCERRSCARSDA
jgi:hypothetical protein